MKLNELIFNNERHIVLQLHEYWNIRTGRRLLPYDKSSAVTVTSATCYKS
jgi:hypothetical protein